MHNHVALLWDLQNVHPSIEQVRSVVCFAEEIGTVVRNDKFVYGHWSGNEQKWETIFDDLDFTCINAPASKDKKNNADKMMIYTGRESIVNKPTISTVILFSKDKDFVPLVKELQKVGKKVILITNSEKKTSRKLKSLVDEFHTLNEIQTRFSAFTIAA